MQGLAKLEYLAGQNTLDLALCYNTYSNNTIEPGPPILLPRVTI